MGGTILTWSPEPSPMLTHMLTCTPRGHWYHGARRCTCNLWGTAASCMVSGTTGPSSLPRHPLQGWGVKANGFPGTEMQAVGFSSPWGRPLLTTNPSPLLSTSVIPKCMFLICLETLRRAVSPAARSQGWWGERRNSMRGCPRELEPLALPAWSRAPQSLLHLGSSHPLSESKCQWRFFTSEAVHLVLGVVNKPVD